MKKQAIKELLEDALSDSTTHDEYLRDAISVLEDGEALAKLGITDQDQENVECLHDELRKELESFLS
jgi:hypothetical protein